MGAPKEQEQGRSRISERARLEQEQGRSREGAAKEQGWSRSRYCTELMTLTITPYLHHDVGVISRRQQNK